MAIPHPSGKTSGRLDYYRIDPETLAQAVSEMSRIAEENASLLQQDQTLAGGILHFENLLTEAQAGDGNALKQVTSIDEFEKLQHLVDAHNNAAASELEYLTLSNDLMAFRARFLPASHAE